MPELSSKHEKVAQGLAAGLWATEACRLAGYSGGGSSSSEISRRPDVVARVKELKNIKTSIASQAEAAAVRITAVTKAYIVDEVMAQYAGAKADGARGVALEALKLAASLMGYVVQKRDTRVVRSFEDLTDDELERLAAEAEQGDDTPPSTSH